VNTERQRHRRRNYFSNPKAQTRIIVFFSVLAFIYAAVNFYIGTRGFLVASQQILSLRLDAGALHDIQIVLKEQAAILRIQLTLFALLALCMVAMGAVLLSHRIGGPMYQLGKYLNGVSDGTVKPRRIRFRRDDFFHEVADAFNQFQEKRGILPEEEPVREERPPA
jgi:hypothetical protein